MSSEEGGGSEDDDDEDDAAESRSRVQPQDLSKDQFRQLVMDLATWCDGRGLLGMLKVLFRDIVDVNQDLQRASNVTELLSHVGPGILNEKNLTILYDTVKVTKQSGFTSTIKEKLYHFQNIDKLQVTSFTKHRINILNFGKELTDSNIEFLDGRYNFPKLKKYEDSWSLITDLETQGILKEEHIKEFREVLQQNGMESADRCFIHDKPGRSKQKKKSRKEEDEKIRKYLLSNQQNLYGNLKWFTPQNMNSIFQLNIIDMFTDMEILKSDTKKADGELIQLTDVLQIIQSKPGCRVLISGEGGIGKTTLLRYFAYNWATKDSFTIFEGKLLFLINIRDLNKGETILNVILKQIDLEDFGLSTNLAEDPKLIKQFIMNHDDEIVIMLDGLDELKFENKSPLQLFRKERLKMSSVIVTSRSININEYIRWSNTHLNVKGFDKTNVKSYIKRYFKHVDKSKLADSLNKNFDSYDFEEKHLEVYMMSKNPMLLLSICFMWEKNQHLPTDKADLFKSFFLCILNQFDRQDNPLKICKFERIPEEYVTAMVLLGRCMYKQLKKNQLSFTKDDLDTTGIDRDNDEMIDMTLKLGFVYEDSMFDKSNLAKYFTAPHKLIAESLVGFYLYKLCETSGLESECENMKLLLSPLDDTEWEIIRESEYLIMSREFAIGFLGASAGKFLKHWITDSFQTYRSLILLLKCVNEKNMEEVEKSLMNHITETKLKIEIGSVCNSLQMFLAHTKTNEHVSTKNVVHLMRKVYNTEQITDNFCDNMLCKEKGKALAHTLIAVSNQEQMLGSITGDYINYVIDECEKHDMKYDMDKLYVYHTTTTEFLVHIITHSPKLRHIDARHNTITGTVLNDVLFHLCRKSVTLKTLTNITLDGNNLSELKASSLYLLFDMCSNMFFLSMRKCFLSSKVFYGIIKRYRDLNKLPYLDISENNLSQIDSDSLLSLVLILSRRYMPDMHSCNLSGGLLNEMISNCSRGPLTLRDLDISDNNLCKIDGSTLAFLLSGHTTPVNFHNLNMHNCSLSGDIVNKTISNLSSRGFTFNAYQLDISDNNFSEIDGASLASLINISTDQFPSYLNMHNCCLSSNVVNDMTRVFSSKCFTLQLSRLDISDNNLSEINCSSFTFLMSIGVNVRNCFPSELILHNCSLTGDMMNEMIRECSDLRVAFRLTKLDISDNNLSKIDGTLLASLMNTSYHSWHLELNMHNCSLSGDIVNDMIKECSRKRVILRIEKLDISDNNLSQIDGASLAYLINTDTRDSRVYINMQHCSLSGKVINDMIRKLSACKITRDMNKLDISDNNLTEINGASLGYLMSCFRTVSMHNCSLSDKVIKNMIRECSSSRGVTFRLDKLNLSDNNLSGIDGASLASLITMGHAQRIVIQLDDELLNENSSGEVVIINASQMRFASLSSNVTLNVHNCGVSGEVMNALLTDCVSKRITVKEMDISDNNLNTIDGGLLASLLSYSMSKKCYRDNCQYRLIMETVLNMHNCSLSGNILNDMIRKCSRTFRIDILTISDNDLSQIDGASLASLMSRSYDVNMHNCSLSGDVIKDMIKECSRRGVSLRLDKLDISDNNLSRIDGTSLALLLSCPCDINMHNCSLSGDVMKDTIEKCSRDNLRLDKLDMSYNNLSTIDGVSLTSLLNTMGRSHCELNMHNCSLPDELINEVINNDSSKEAIFRKIK